MNPFILLWTFLLFISLTLQIVRPLAMPTGTAGVLQVQHNKPATGKTDKAIENASKPAGTPTIHSPAVILKLAFMAEPSLFPYELECHIHDKTIELTGTVSMEEEKALAATVTAHLMSGKEIVNHLEVRPALRATLQHTGDMRLTEMIRQRFATSQTLRDANFEILSIRGMVSLKGQTRFPVIALEAAQAAREIPGVMAVNTQQIHLEGEND